jgi:DNA-binding transcriptional LysR family regulator
VLSIGVMDLRQLAAVTAVGEHGSFSAAADALNTVQSNISTHVARLEKELGVLLVDRQRGQLTDEGRAVVERARRVNLELEALVAEVAALRNEVIGQVRVGIIGTTARWLVPRVIERSAQRFPKLQLIVVEAGSSTLEPQLLTGRLDLAVVNLPVPGSDLVERHLFDEDLVLVVANEHPMADLVQVDISALDGIPLLIPARDTGYRKELDVAAAAAGITIVAKAELDGVRLIASLTFDGHGPAILPATALPDFMGDRFKRVFIGGLARRQVGIALRRRGLPSAPTRALISLLDEIAIEGVSSHEGLHPPGLG